MRPFRSRSEGMIFFFLLGATQDGSSVTSDRDCFLFVCMFQTGTSKALLEDSPAALFDKNSVRCTLIFFFLHKSELKILSCGVVKRKLARLLGVTASLAS